MSEALLLSMIDRLDEQQRKMDELHEKLELMSRCSNTFSEIINKLDAVRNDVQNISLPIKEVREFSTRLATTTELIKVPLKKEIVHHHHISKVLWVTGVLFLLVCLISTGWFITANSLKAYKANDTKYRYIKLLENKGFNKALQFVDSLYIKDRNMRNEVIEKEKENQREFEMLQRAYEMEKSAKELKQQVNKADSRRPNKSSLKLQR